MIGGNGLRAVGAIAALEQTLERPVVTANQALLWAALKAAGADPSAVAGYGRIFRVTGDSQHANLGVRSHAPESRADRQLPLAVTQVARTPTSAAPSGGYARRRRGSGPPPRSGSAPRTS